MKDNIIILCDTGLGKTDEETYSSNKRGIEVLIKDSVPVNDLKWENVMPGKRKINWKMK